MRLLVSLFLSLHLQLLLLLLLLLLLSPICLISAQTLDPYADDLYVSQCLPFDVPLGGQQKACITARVNRCDPTTVGATLNVVLGSTNKTYIVNRNASTFDTPQCLYLPAFCGSDSKVCVSLDDKEFKITPSYLRLQPIIKGNCRTPIQPAPRALSVGADCMSATSCDECTSMPDAQSRTPCGWCTTVNKCYASDPKNRPYCFAECTQNGLLRNGQCALAAQSTEWSAGKTAMVVVLAVVIPVIVILLVLLILRHYRLKKQGASSPGVIQARTQGYRQNVDHSVSNTNVDTETSLNAPNSNAEFRQMPETEGYQPPSSRPSTASAV